jgi:hypothetical protein
MENFVERWLEVNRQAEDRGDWRMLADFYTDDATYGWNIGSKEDVMCVGIDEIRDVAVGLEMDGLENWRYPYQRLIIDDKLGEVVGWQRDFFDFGHVQKLYLDLMAAGKLSAGMQKRIERSLAGEKLPGYHPLGNAPVPIW